MESDLGRVIDIHNFPRVIGGIDRKYVRIYSPESLVAHITICMKNFSMMLLVNCDANYSFMWLDFGKYGSLNDASALINSDLLQETRE